MDAVFWSLLLIIAGVAFLLLEIILPSAGVLSILAGLSFIGALVVAFSGSVRLGVIVLAVEMFLIPVLIISAVKFWPHTPIGRMILIRLPKSADEILPDDPVYRDLKSLVGKRGKAKTLMLPSGSVVVGGRTYDAFSEGMPIEAGEPVQVVAVRTNRIVVRPAKEGAGDDESTPSVSEEEENILDRPLDALGLEPFDDPLA